MENTENVERSGQELNLIDYILNLKTNPAARKMVGGLEAMRKRGEYDPTWVDRVNVLAKKYCPFCAVETALHRSDGLILKRPGSRNSQEQITYCERYAELLERQRECGGFSKRVGK